MPNLKNATLLTTGQITVYGCSFIKNVILAHTLTKADFGLVSIFALTTNLFEIAGRMSFGVQVIQNKEGDSHRFISCLHAAKVCLSLISSVILLSCSTTFASIFGVPDIWWAFAILAAIPLITSFDHLDIYKFRREFKYLPGIYSEIIPQIATTVITWPLALWLGDFRVILWLIVSKAFLSLFLTHLYAKQPYKAKIDKNLIISILNFSWPLALNAFLIFLSQQADQLIVGSFLSLEDLASYAAAFSFAIMPYFLMTPVLNNLFLPILSRLQEDISQFTIKYKDCVQTSALFAVFTLSPIIAMSEHIVQTMYGSKYQGAGPLVAILGVTCAFRCLRNAPSIAAISKADTVNQFYSNIVRCISILLTPIFLINGLSLYFVALSALLSELAATTYSIIRLRNKQHIPLNVYTKPVTLIILSSSISILPLNSSEPSSLLKSLGFTLIIFLSNTLLAKLLLKDILDKIDLFEIIKSRVVKM